MEPQYQRIEAMIFSNYGAKPEFLWKVFPEYAIFRHAENRKWFGLLMNVSPEKLIEKIPPDQARMPEAVRTMAKIHVLGLKMPQTEIPAIYETTGIYPGYPRNVGGWISVVLEELLPDFAIMDLVAKSYKVTSKKR